MSDERALRRAVLAAPDDDLPRLVYADWLDDEGQLERAAFIRDQVALAKTPPWEPFAVRARHHRPEVLSGRPWRNDLPSFGDAGLVEWHAERPFRRGFGWCVRVRQLGAFLASAENLFVVEPVGELVLPAATRDEWELFAQQPWLANVKALRFTTGSGLSEPIRALANSPFASRLDSIAFEVSTSPGMGAVVELLVQSPLAGQLKELEFRIGHDRDGDILDELNRADQLKLESLTLATMGQGAEALAHLANLPNSPALQSLSIQHQLVSGAVADALRAGLQRFPLSQFMVLAGQLTGRDVQGLAERSLNALQSLNFSENIFGEGGLSALVEPGRFDHLRALHLARCGLDDRDAEQLVGAAFWPNLVELDLRGNRLTDAGAESLIAAATPQDLAALLLGDMPWSDAARDRLQAHFGECLVS